MKRIFVFVEGQTEETFVREILYPYFSKKEILITPKIAVTKRKRNGQVFRGGLTNYQKVRRDIVNLLYVSGINLITTMIDYYGLPESFPGKDHITNQNPFEKVKIIEEEFKKDINDPRFLPYLSLHEFEAILFTSPLEISKALLNRNSLEQLTKITEQFNSPEEINDSPITAPSKRLRRIFPHYEKVVYGSLISKRIGLEAIRQKCTHFNQWLEKLESI